jgi:hypothetical protein
VSFSALNYALRVFDKDRIGFALATLLRGRNAALAAIDASDSAVDRATGRYALHPLRLPCRNR